MNENNALLNGRAVYVHTRPDCFTSGQHDFCYEIADPQARDVPNPSAPGQLGFHTIWDPFGRTEELERALEEIKSFAARGFKLIFDRDRYTCPGSTRRSVSNRVRERIMDRVGAQQ